MKLDVLEAVWCEHCGRYHRFKEASVVEGVCCVRCGRLCLFDSLEYFVVSGNITIGAEGGLVGNVLEGDAASHSVYCVECLIEYLTKSAAMVSVK